MNSKTNEELLRVLLRSEKTAAAISKIPIANLVGATRHELGLSEAAYGRLHAAIEFGRRVGESKNPKPKKITSSSDAIEYCQLHFSRLIQDGLQEEFHIVTLNTKNVVIDSHLITIGTLDASLVHPREVFRKAIKDAASSVLLAHNHPSGDPTPSREDIAVTNRLDQVGELVGITVLDHIVMAKDGTMSIREVE